MIQVNSQYFNIINEDAFLDFCRKQNLTVSYLSHKLVSFSGEVKYLFDKTEFNMELVKFIDFEINKTSYIQYTEIDTSQAGNYIGYASTVHKNGTWQTRVYNLNDSSI